MKTSLNWISLYTDINNLIESKGIKDLAHLYSIHTAEIDAIFNFLNEDKIVVGKVLEAKKHPGSDHLNIVKVDLNNLGINQIVCGASNVLESKYVAVATVGTMIKGEFEIKQAKLRGEESNGMICSEDELGIQDDRASGIMRLEDYFEVNYLEQNIGKPFGNLLVGILNLSGTQYQSKLKDVVFEIDNKFITNRPDLFSIEGNAREFAAIFDLPFSPYEKKYEFNFNNLNTIIETDKVLAYHLLKIENVSTSESPFGIKNFLYKSGINPKFDLVDMTNYIMTELGQPMHAFDADKINGNIIVRLAKQNEKMIALNGEEYELKENDIVIADCEKILAIGGIIGGQSSAISETTKNIYIESACFDPVSVRLTSQRLGIRTDSSTRYEKSLDPLLTYKALSRALDFLNFINKPGILVGDSEYIDISKINNIEIKFQNDFIYKKLGINISLENSKKILTALGFSFSYNNSEFVVKVPSWRATKDISIKEDIIEEIGRIYSYTNIPEIPLKGDNLIASKNSSIFFKKNIRDYFSSKGLFEVYNYSFSNEILDKKIGLLDLSDSIKIINAYSNEFSLMRREMLPNLLLNVQNNIKTSKKFSFFEIGKVSNNNNGVFTEKSKIGIISVGVEYSEFRGYIDGFLSLLSHFGNYKITQSTGITSNYFHPNKSGLVIVNDIEIGKIGFINPKVSAEFDIGDDNLIYCELDFNLTLDIFNNTDFIFNELPKYPGIDRELNFVMDKNTVLVNVIDEIKSVDNFYIKNIKILDIYENSEKIGENKKSVTFSVFLQDNEKTMTDELALKIQNLIINKLKQKNIELRK